jgi:hypothetical protein
MLPKEKISLTLPRIILLSAMFFLIFFSMFCLTASASQSDAAVSISSAQNRIADCYSAAKAAEVAGANITVLTNVLNKAGFLFSQAQLAYSEGNFDTATTYAVQSQDQLDTFIGQADSLTQAASQQKSRDFLINVVGSIVGSFLVVVTGFAVWFLIKRRSITGDANATKASTV